MKYSIEPTAATTHHVLNVRIVQGRTNFFCINSIGWEVSSWMGRDASLLRIVATRSTP
jgi:hypothetical protein